MESNSSSDAIRWWSEPPTTSTEPSTCAFTRRSNKGELMQQTILGPHNAKGTPAPSSIVLVGRAAKFWVLVIWFASVLPQSTQGAGATVQLGAYISVYGGPVILSRP